MKKKLLSLSFLVIGLMLTVGCSNSASKDDINLMSSDKAEVVVKSEYVSRLSRLCDETISLPYDKKSKKYDEKYKSSKVIKEEYYGGDRDMYKDFTEKLSTFRTKDDNINELHDKLIEVSLDVYNLYKEMIDLSYERKVLTDKSLKVRITDFTDEELEKMDTLYERINLIEAMIENQEEHVENILTEISYIAGIR